MTGQPEPQPTVTEPQHRAQVSALCDLAFGQGRTTVVDLADLNRGRGAFSVVLRAELAWHGAPPPGGGPASVAAKLPVEGPNGEAARVSGAYDREALAYRELLSGAPLATPTCYAVQQPGDGSCSLLLEDLSAHRWFDQLDGLPAEVAVSVAGELTRFHRAWVDDDRLGLLSVRRNTIASLPDEALTAGLARLETTWAEELGAEERARYHNLVDARPKLVEMFEAAEPTLCHGDPRADNFVLDRAGRMVLFDWQQMAVQFGEADLAWLSATSLNVETRRRIDNDLVEAYGGSFDRYRLGLALPGLAVLLLAQREVAAERTRRFVAASLTRIAAALADLDVVGLI